MRGVLSEAQGITYEIEEGNILYCFTTHARERWAERIGGVLPSEREIDQLIEESVVVQKFRKAYTPRGWPMVFLAVYWHPGRGVVIKVDEPCGKVVTVLGPVGTDCFALSIVRKEAL